MLAEKLLEGYSGFYGISESYEIADPITYLNEVAIEAVTALHEAAQQYYIGDIIAQSQVIMEGVTGEALMESAGSKAKALWEAFKKRVKDIIDKVIEKLRKFVNWIRSKFSKKNNDPEQLIKDIKSFDANDVSKKKGESLQNMKDFNKETRENLKARREQFEKPKERVSKVAPPKALPIHAQSHQSSKHTPSDIKSTSNSDKKEQGIQVLNIMSPTLRLSIICGTTASRLRNLNKGVCTKNDIVEELERILEEIKDAGKRVAGADFISDGAAECAKEDIEKIEKHDGLIPWENFIKDANLEEGLKTKKEILERVETLKSEVDAVSKKNTERTKDEIVKDLEDIKKCMNNFGGGSEEYAKEVEILINQLNKMNGILSNLKFDNSGVLQSKGLEPQKIISILSKYVTNSLDFNTFVIRLFQTDVQYMNRLYNHYKQSWEKYKSQF